MATLVRMPKAAWRRQPPLNSQLNLANPLTTQLDACFLGMQTPALGINTESALYSSVTPEIVSDSYGLGVDLSVTRFWTFADYHDSWTLIPAGGSSSYLCVVQKRPAVASTMVIFTDYDSDGNVLVRIGDSGDLEVIVWTDTTVQDLLPGKIESDSICVIGLSLQSLASTTEITCAVNGQLYSMTLSGQMKRQHYYGFDIGARLGSSFFQGIMGLFCYYTRALEPAELIEATTNPWQLFNPRPARFILIPDGAGGGLSAYQDSLFRWNIYESVQNDEIIRWNTLYSVQQDIALRWNLLTTTQQDFVLHWNSTEWTQSDATLRWNLLANIQNDITLRWDLLSSALQDATIRWNELSPTQQDSVLRWDALSNVLSAQQDVELHWNSLSQTQQDIIARWNLTNSIEQSFSARWNATQSVELSASLRWQIAESIASDLLLRWNELEQLSATQDLVLRWDLTTTAQRDVVLRWTIGDSVQSLPLSTLLVVMAEDRILRVDCQDRILRVH